MKICLALFSYGGVAGRTVESLIYEISVISANRVEVSFIRVKDDALISRSRSVVLSRFLAETDADVLFMLDHDISWETGDILTTCLCATSTNSPVAGLYACRAFGYGVSSRLQENTNIILGLDKLIEAKYLASGFLAITRGCAQKIIDSGQVESFKVGDMGPYYDFFMPVIHENEYLSEDWAFSLRATNSGVKNYIYCKPMLKHHGYYGFTVPDGTEKPKEKSV